MLEHIVRHAALIDIWPCLAFCEDVTMSRCLSISTDHVLYQTLPHTIGKILTLPLIGDHVNGTFNCKVL